MRPDACRHFLNVVSNLLGHWADDPVQLSPSIGNQKKGLALWLGIRLDLGGWAVK